MSKIDCCHCVQYTTRLCPRAMKRTDLKECADYIEDPKASGIMRQVMTGVEKANVIQDEYLRAFTRSLASIPVVVDDKLPPGAYYVAVSRELYNDMKRVSGDNNGKNAENSIRTPDQGDR